MNPYSSRKILIYDFLEKEPPFQCFIPSFFLWFCLFFVFMNLMNQHLQEKIDKGETFVLLELLEY